MIVSKEVAEKAYEYHKLKEKVDKLYDELKDYFDNYIPNYYFTDFKICNYPEGENLIFWDFCDQSVGYYEDDYHGTYYCPIEDCDMFPTFDDKPTYIAISYAC